MARTHFPSLGCTGRCMTSHLPCCISLKRTPVQRPARLRTAGARASARQGTVRSCGPPLVQSRRASGGMWSLTRATQGTLEEFFCQRGGTPRRGWMPGAGERAGAHRGSWVARRGTTGLGGWECARW
ncbi:hypothetical protein BD414DRAFT_497041 [Trametes punicea]|nr:hypothetical protein BD414DRAFT_497041 [Trametes punicea]